MVTSIYLFVVHGVPFAVERVKKLFSVPLGLKISASWSILHTLEMPKWWFDVICLFFSLWKQLNSCTCVFEIYFPFTKGEGKRRKLSFPSTVDNFRATFRSPRYSFFASYEANEWAKIEKKKKDETNTVLGSHIAVWIVYFTQNHLNCINSFALVIFRKT